MGEAVCEMVLPGIMVYVFGEVMFMVSVWSASFCSVSEAPLMSTAKLVSGGTSPPPSPAFPSVAGWP